MADDIRDRKSLTFEQAEGAASLPAQMAPKEVSKELRAKLWAMFRSFLRERDVGSITYQPVLAAPWEDIIIRHYVNHLHGFVDDFDRRFEVQISELKGIFAHGNYVRIFGFLQFVIRDVGCPRQFKTALDETLKVCRSAYRIIDGDTIAPLSSEIEAENVRLAIEALKGSGNQGALKHLKDAISFLTTGDWAGSIRESVHAVESTARQLAPGSTSLGPALARLEKDKRIHEALKRGFSAIYGYTSDEKGIRHPLLSEDAAASDEADALFMLGACSAFCSYLNAKAPKDQR